ncbi:hypothetical protein CVS40_4169 [Lucilia cuprina]|nr:hypothetical protein CVS40_4169 [Lucilia cuprina]
MPWKPAIERACEVSALKQSRHADCSFKAVPRKSVWKQLSSENHWIFTVFDNLILTVDCGLSNRSWITLPLKGILQLPYGCTAAYEGITLTASKQFTSEKKTTIQSSSWELDYKKINSKLVKPFDITIINNTKYIEKLQKDVEIMKAKNIELRELNFHTAPGHASFIIILISIIVLIFVYIKYKCCNKNAVVKLDFSPPVSYSARQNVQTN